MAESGITPMNEIFMRNKHRDTKHLYFDLKDSWRFFASAEIKACTMLEF